MIYTFYTAKTPNIKQRKTKMKKVQLRLMRLIAAGIAVAAMGFAPASRQQASGPSSFRFDLRSFTYAVSDDYSVDCLNALFIVFR
jgi:hypothetical protein